VSPRWRESFLQQERLELDTCMCAHAHLRAHTPACTHMPACTHTPHTYTHAHTWTHTHGHTPHTCTRMDTHVQIHTHTLTMQGAGQWGSVAGGSTETEKGKDYRVSCDISRNSAVRLDTVAGRFSLLCSFPGSQTKLPHLSQPLPSELELVKTLDVLLYPGHPSLKQTLCILTVGHHHCPH
jgi:hypothetical protein